MAEVPVNPDDNINRLAVVAAAIPVPGHRVADTTRTEKHRRFDLLALPRTLIQCKIMQIVEQCGPNLVSRLYVMNLVAQAIYDEYIELNKRDDLDWFPATDLQGAVLLVCRLALATTTASDLVNLVMTMQRQCSEAAESMARAELDSDSGSHHEDAAERFDGRKSGILATTPRRNSPPIARASSEDLEGMVRLSVQTFAQPLLEEMRRASRENDEIRDAIKAQFFASKPPKRPKCKSCGSFDDCECEMIDIENSLSKNDLAGGRTVPPTFPSKSPSVAPSAVNFGSVFPFDKVVFRPECWDEILDATEGRGTIGDLSTELTNTFVKCPKLYGTTHANVRKTNETYIKVLLSIVQTHRQDPDRLDSPGKGHYHLIAKDMIVQMRADVIGAELGFKAKERYLDFWRQSDLLPDDFQDAEEYASNSKKKKKKASKKGKLSKSDLEEDSTSSESSTKATPAKPKKAPPKQSTPKSVPPTPPAQSASKKAVPGAFGGPANSFVQKEMYAKCTQAQKQQLTALFQQLQKQ